MKNQKILFALILTTLLFIPLLALSSNAQTINLNNGISRYYTLDSNDNILYDLVNDSVAINNNGVSQTGIFNDGISNSGSNNIKINDTEGIDYSNGFTLSFWYKPLTSSGFGTIFSSENTVSTLFLRLESGGGLETLLRYNGVNIAHSPTSGHYVTVGLFEHHTLTYDGVNFKYYVNGSLLSTVAYSGDTNHIINLFGHDGASYSSSNGVYDEIIKYNRALNDDEIMFLYDEQPLNNPLARFPFSPTFEEPEVQTIGFNNVTHNSVELIGNLTSIGTLENVSVFFQYKKQFEQDYINTNSQLLIYEQEFIQLIEGLEQNTPYEFRAVVQYENPDIVGALIKNATTNNFTTEPIIFTDNFLIGKRFKGNSRDNIFKYDLVNDNYLEYETENFISGTNRFWFDYNNDIISLIDRNPDVSYRLTILNFTDLTIIEEILIPNSQFTNPSGVSLSENELFVGVENKIFVLNLDTYTGSYSTPYSTFSNDINIVETDDSNVYFTRKNSGGMWSFEKDNINMSFTPENSFSTSTPKEIILLQNEVFIIGQNEVRLFTKDNTLVFNTSLNNDNYVFGSLSYDETRNKIYYATQNTLGICPQFNLYEVDLSNGQINNTLNIDYENSACVDPYFIGVSYDDELIYLTGTINSDNTMRIYSKNTYGLLEEQETPYRLDQTSITGSLQIAETVPTILGFPPVIQLNQNEQFSINLGDYFNFAETINLSVQSQNPNDVLPENFSFNGIYNYNYTQFEYEPLTFQLDYLSKLLDFEVVFKATACNEFGCVQDLLKIETFIIPLVIEKSFPDILIKPDSFKYYFVDDYINEEEENITTIILRDEDLNQELVYTYSVSENIINQYYSLTMSEDVNGRTFIYVESFSEEHESNMTIKFVDSDGIEIIEEFKLIITENIPLNIKSVPNPIMNYNDLYELNLSEYYEEYTIVFFGWYETDNNEYKFLLPNEEFSTSYAEFSYINDTISIKSFEENYFFETSPASIQACNTNGCIQTTELVFTISEESFFDNTFGSLFPSSETLSNSQKMTRVLITIMALIGLVVILGVQSPEARPYLVPVGSLVVMLSIIAFTLMGYLSVVLLLTLIFVGVMIGVGLVRRILQGSSGGD